MQVTAKAWSMNRAEGHRPEVSISPECSAAHLEVLGVCAGDSAGVGNWVTCEARSDSYSHLYPARACSMPRLPVHRRMHFSHFSAASPPRANSATCHFMTTSPTFATVLARLPRSQ